MSKLLSQTPIDYKEGLQVIVSDTTVSDTDPQKRSYRLPIDSIPSVGRQWDVTPIVVENYTPDLEIADSYFLAGNVDDLSLDLQTPTVSVQGQPIFKHGAAKTNINLGLLADGDSWHLSLEQLVAPTNQQYGLLNLAFINANTTASEAATRGLSVLLAETQSDYFYGIGITTNAGGGNGPSYAYNIFATEHDSGNNTFDMVYVNDTGDYPNHETIIGERAVLLVTRHGGALSIALANIDANGTYDIRAVSTHGSIDNPVPFANLTLYLYFGTINLGGGYWSPHAKASITEGLPGYSVADTKYLQTNEQGDWDAIFSTSPHRPSGDLITPTLFPANVRIGEVLNSYVSPTYSGALLPSAYGQTLQNKQLLLVTNITAGQQAFERVVRGAEMDAVSAQIAQLSTGSAEIGEVVVYVGSGIAATNGSGTYDTFDEAYEHLITLPVFIRKRIVFDDRPIDNSTYVYITGLENNGDNKIYLLRANNIVLSTYTAYLGVEYVDAYNAPPQYTIPPLFQLMFRTDGLWLEDFWGGLHQLQNDNNNIYTLFDVSQSIISPITATLQPALVVGKGAKLWLASGNIETQHGGRISLRGNGYVSAYLYMPSQTYPDAPLVFTADKQSRIELYGSLPLIPIAAPAIEIYHPHNGLKALLNTDLELTTREYFIDDIRDEGFTFDDAFIIRNFADFNINAQQGMYIPLDNSNALYVVIGRVELYGLQLRPFGVGDIGYDQFLNSAPDGGFTYRFVGVGKAELFSATAPVFVDDADHPGRVICQNVELSNGAAAPSTNDKRAIVTGHTSFDLTHVKINARAGVRIDDAVAVVGQIAHDLRHVVFNMDQNAAGEATTIFSRRHVLMHDIVILGADGANPVIDLVSQISGADDVGYIDIDRIVVKYANAPTVPVFRINSTGYARRGAIGVKNITFIPNESIANNQLVPKALFCTDADAVYEYSTDYRIATDTLSPWYSYTNNSDSIGVSISAQNVPVNVGLPNGVSKGYSLSQSGAGHVLGSSGVDRLYHYNIRARIVAPIAGQSAVIGIIRGDGSGPVGQKVRCDGAGNVGYFNMTFPIHMGYDSILLTVMNPVSDNDFLLEDITVNVTSG